MKQIIDEMLEKRRLRHGNWRANSEVSQLLKINLASTKEFRPPQINEGLDAICVKLARIATGDPMFIDHWDDIQGYAKLVSDFLRNEKC